LDYYGLMFQLHPILAEYKRQRAGQMRRLRFSCAWASEAPIARAPVGKAAVAVAMACALLPAFAQPVRAPVAASAPESAASAPVSSAMDGELFYQLLLGELNTFGGEAASGYALILDAARKTNDPKLYERAVTIALQSRSGDSALQAARAWSKAQPASRDANRYVLQILVGLNRIGETLEPLKSEVASTPARERVAVIGAIPRFYARASDKKLAANVVEQALADALVNPATGAAAWVTVGRMRLDAADTPGVLDAARRAQALDPAAEGPPALALSMMGPKLPQAEAIVRKYLEGKPQVEIRMGYARALIDAQRYTEAATQLVAVTAEKPDHPQAWLVRGTLEVQDRKFDQGEKSLKRHLEVAQAGGAARSPEVNRGLAQAYLSLAQIAENRKDFALAESWLGKIDNADDMVGAQSRRATILAKQGKIEEGRKLLRALPEKVPSDARMKLMAEVQLLRDFKQYKAAYELVAEKTRTGPPDYELLYDQAMLAEKLDRLDEMERLLRQIIAGKPEYQHAYNALGYSFAERNMRLPEAKALILKALDLAPGDPFISDSLGWVEFRSGNTAEALRILETAFKTRPDAEIAAHLGEVLWVSGKREQALAVWREGSALNAENETLVETLKRFRVKL
jgi:tetratricopeptide (TPR) repeat protein